MKVLSHFFFYSYPSLVFLVIMASGILSRLISWIVDGRPNEKMFFFMLYEAVGLLIIFIYTKNKTSRDAS